MNRRVYSLETEYALACETAGGYGRGPQPQQEIYDRLEPEILRRTPHAACDPTRMQAQDAASSLVGICEGYFLANGARLYYDNGHLEWAAPEADNPYQALVYDRAGERELAAAVAAVEKAQPGGRPLVIKNNLDYSAGTSYGCHENYSVRRFSNGRREVMSQVVSWLVPFFVTRQIICGAGRLGADCAPHVAFQLSQRADFITCVASVDTREKRPIVNQRDEPLADPNRLKRLHLISGDSNMAEYSAFLKLGMTGLLLDMLEADAPLPDLTLAAPEEAFREVSRDLTFTRRLPLQSGDAESAVDIQRAYWQAARDFVAQRRDSDTMTWGLVQLWDGLLTAIERRAPELEFCLDWAIKRRLFDEALGLTGVTWDELDAWEPIRALTSKVHLPAEPPKEWETWMRRRMGAAEWDAIESQRRKYGLDWRRYARVRRAAANLRVMDIRYHDVDPRHSLFHRWSQATPIIQDEAEIEAARQIAPENTRAGARAAAIRLAREYDQSVKMDWHRVHLISSGQRIALDNPLSNDLPAVKRAFADEFIPIKVMIDDRPEEDSEVEIVVLSVEDL